MKVAFDANMLIDLLNPRLLEDRRLRLDALIKELEEKKAVVVVPTPALAELLVRAGAAQQQYLDHLTKSRMFRVVAFHQKAAIECAIALKRALDTGNKRAGSPSTWAKVKFDWQIVAIARVEGVKTIYSDDVDVVRFGGLSGIDVVRPVDLPLPAEAAQTRLPF